MRASALLSRSCRLLCLGPFSRAAHALDQDMNMQSRARVYADVNVTRPRDYWDYETLTVQWGCALLHIHPSAAACGCCKTAERRQSHCLSTCWVGLAGNPITKLI